MRRKHIGFLIGNISSKGGAERTFSLIANGLIDYYDITVISYVYGEKSAYHLDNRVKVKFLFHKNEKQRERYVLKPFYFSKLRNEIKLFDCIVVVSSAAALGLLCTTWMRNLKVITWEQTSFANKMYMSFKRIILQRIAFLWSDYFISLTNANLKLIKNCIFSKSKHVAIYNAVDENILNNKVCYDVSSTQIITFARIERVKGLDILVKVAAKVLKKHPKWTWKIYGQIDDKEYFEELNKMTTDYDLTNQLHFCSPVDDIVPVLSKSSIYVMTSRYEGLPMSLLEAKAMKLPSVAFDCPTGPSEIIQDGINGDLVPCYDVEIMSEKICDLISNEVKRMAYSDNAHNNIGKFRMENIVQEWRELLG